MSVLFLLSSAALCSGYKCYYNPFFRSQPDPYGSWSNSTRYYERAVLLLKRAILLLILMPFLVKTDSMLADVMTKATDRGTFLKMRNIMMNVNYTLRERLENGLSMLCGGSKRMVRSLMDRV